MSLNYSQVWAILDSNDIFSTTPDYTTMFSQDELDKAKNQCFIWSSKDVYSILGRKYKSTIKGLYPLLCHIKKHTRNNIVYISQTDKSLLPFYNNDQPKIHYAIHSLLIEKAKVLCDLKSAYKPHSVAKYYYVCLETLDTMFELYKSLAGSQTNVMATEGEVLEPAYYLLPSFNSTLRIYEDYSFDEVREAVLMRYPCMPYYNNLLAQLNAHAFNDDEIIRFSITPKFSQKGKITKLGIRAFSNTCLLKSLEKQKKKCRQQGREYVVDPNIRYREHYLNERFGEWEEYDIKGSVPRVSRAMANRGDMGDLNEDIYRTMFEPFVQDFQICFDESVAEWCEKARSFFKLLFMRLFFGGTPKQIVSRILDKEKKEKDKAIKKGRMDEGLSPFASLAERGVDLVSLIDKYQKRVFEYCCRTPKEARDTSVFLHESCIYLEVRKELFNRGIDVVQVYDGFYFKKGTIPLDMEEIIQRAALEYCNGNKKFAQFNARKGIGKALREMPLDTTNITETPTTLSDADVIGTNIEFIKPGRKK